jgi:hypothetical protein
VATLGDSSLGRVRGAKGLTTTTVRRERGCGWLALGGVLWRVDVCVCVCVGVSGCTAVVLSLLLWLRVRVSVCVCVCVCVDEPITLRLQGMLCELSSVVDGLEPLGMAVWWLNDGVHGGIRPAR